VFVADEIPPELQRIVEFLNKQMCPADVLAVEVGYYAGGDLRTLVPRVVGYTAEAQDKKAATKTERRIWDETSYFEDLAARTSPQAIDTARTLHEWAKTNATTIRFGTGATKGGLGAVVGSLELNKRVFTMYSDGRLELCFYSLMGLPPFDQDAKRLEWSKKLNELPPFNISEEQIAKFPTIGLEELADAELLKIFLSTLDWVVDEVRTASEN